MRPHLNSFTLIEILVIIGILTLLTSFLLLYGRAGEKQIILFREQAKVISVVARAKSLALSTPIEDEPACGYGVHFEEDGYFIFRDIALGGVVNCPVSDKVYSSQNPEELLSGQERQLDPQIHFSSLPIRDVLFVPYAPQAFLDGSNTLNEAQLRLSPLDESLGANIIINNVGQVSSQ